MATPKPSVQAMALLSILFLMAAGSSAIAKDLPLFHAHGPSPSWSKTLTQISSNDACRFLFLSNLAASTRKTVTPIASGFQSLHSPNYILSAAVGQPPQNTLMALDTSNDVAWIPCLSCSGCSSSLSLFNSVKSSSFSHILCGNPRCQQVPNPICQGTRCLFNMTYGGAAFQASLSRDTLHIAGDNFTGYAFGCLTKVSGSLLPPQGLLGLGQGPISFISQTHETYRSTFSYCLPSLRSFNFSGSLRLGPVGQPINIKTTPLLSSPRRPSLYYVNLAGIVVGRRLLPIPPSALAFNAATGAGTIIDSGTMFTRLVAPAYAALRDEFRRRIVNKNVTSLGGFDTCYEGPIAAPNITFLFKGMNVTLPPENTLIHSSAGNTVCLAMAAAPNNINAALNVIAGMQQQNHRILVDLPNRRIGVARELCTV